MTAEDSSNNPVPSYLGTVKLTCSDSNAVYNTAALPANYTFVASDNGSHTFTVTLQTAGSKTITLTDQANSSLTATTSPITVSAGAFSKFALTVVGGNTVVAGGAFLLTAQATDAFGNPISSTLTNITATISPTDPHFPVSAPVNSSGFAFFLGTLQTAGSYTITAGGSSTNVTVTPASPDYFTVTAPAQPFAATTGTPFNVTVKAFDRFGNPAAGYTGTVSLSSSDPAMTTIPNYTFLSSDNGVHTFSVTLNSSTLAPNNPGTTLFVRDTTATTPPLTGFSAPITVQGLVVPAGGFQPTATGFTVTFSKAFTAADLTEYGFNTTTVQDVTMVAPKPIGNVPGTLYIDPSAPNTLVFKATSAFLEFANLNVGGDKDSTALPDATYTVTLQSGTGANGFIDALNAHLDGTSTGGTANYTTTFSTTFQNDAGGNANPATVLGIPDFARGPDSSTTITVPTVAVPSPHGIPITLYNVPAAGITDATFTLSYNPQIFAPTAGGIGDAPAGSTFTMGTISSIDSTHASVPFTYHNAALQGAGGGKTLTLGDITASVPTASATIYKTKELLALSNISITGGATVQAADGIHVDAYLGDVHVTALPAIDASDALDEQTMIANKYSGFSAYTLLDPAIIGNVAGPSTIAINGSSVTSLFSKSVNLSVPLIPTIPASVATVSVSGADPTVSLGDAVRAANGIVLVPVLLDDPDPVGSTGMTEAHLALTYDPSVLSVSPSDITLGSISGLGAGWQITSEVDAATGQIGINLFNLARTPITSAQAGSLVNIAFHVVPGAGASEYLSPGHDFRGHDFRDFHDFAETAAPAVQLVSQATPNGQRFVTDVDDSQGPLTLSPGVDRLETWPQARQQTISSSAIDEAIVFIGNGAVPIFQSSVFPARSDTFAEWPDHVTTDQRPVWDPIAIVDRVFAAFGAEMHDLGES